MEIEKMNTESNLKLTEKSGETRVDSRLIAKQLGTGHHATYRLIGQYQPDFDEFGKVLFEKTKPRKGSKGGRPEEYALLNEDQSYLLLTFSKNTVEIRRLKRALIKAFKASRENKSVHKDYLPGYHQLMDTVTECIVHRASEDSAYCKNPSLAFQNINRMINTAFGVKAGERHLLPPRLRGLMITAQYIAEDAIRRSVSNGGDHKEAYQAAKQAVTQFAQQQHLLLAA